MRIAFYDADIAFAARMAIAIKKSISGSEVVYCDTLDDVKLRTSRLVVGDPAPMRTKDWLRDFRRVNPTGVLILISANTDLLSGSFGDPSYAIIKPVKDDFSGVSWKEDNRRFILDVLETIKFLASGRSYTPSKEEAKVSN